MCLLDYLWYNWIYYLSLYQIIEKLSVSSPSAEVRLQVLKEIAKEFNVLWDSSKTEAELSRKPEDLLVLLLFSFIMFGPVLITPRISWLFFFSWGAGVVGKLCWHCWGIHLQRNHVDSVFTLRIFYQPCVVLYMWLRDRSYWIRWAFYEEFLFLVSSVPFCLWFWGCWDQPGGVYIELKHLNQLSCKDALFLSRRAYSWS